MGCARSVYEQLGGAVEGIRAVMELSCEKRLVEGRMVAGEADWGWGCKRNEAVGGSAVEVETETETERGNKLGRP